jgi:Right handed beta helix region
MTKSMSSLSLAALLALGLHVASAQAGLVRTCVSMAKGSDANASSQCHCSTPCRTFATAAANTLADGEITVLDPGDYGGLTITRSISINNDSGGEASITVSGNTTGIIVNAPNGAGYVNLRGLTIQGVGFGSTTGLRFNTGFSLTMEGCVVRNHTGDGIEFFPTGSSNLSMSNTLVADNGGSGIVVSPGSTSVQAALTGVEAYNNSIHGVRVVGTSSTGTINTTVADSVAANNGQHGFSAFSSSGQATNLMVDRSVAANNAVGVSANGAVVTLRVGQSTITGNATSWSVANSAILRSYADNNIDGNGDGDPAPTAIATK